jgi:integrase
VISFLDTIYISQQQLREDQNRHVENYVRLFARIAGDRPMAEYRRLDILNWVRTLEKLKNSIGKSTKDSSKSIPELRKESRGKRTLGQTTIEKHITHLKAFFLAAHRHERWCGREDVEALFHKITLSRDVPGVQDRIPWSIHQLSELLATPTWIGTRSRREDMSRRHEAGPQVHSDSYWWLPIVALFTGARLEELAQLHHDDLKRDQDGIAFLALKTTDPRKQKAQDEKARSKPEAQRLKNRHSFRAVPIHSFLASIGFLDLFQSDRPGTRIWPELKPGGRPPSWGAEYTQDFTKYRRECAIYEELRDFHSFRHTFITCMKTRAKADPLTVAAIVGHTAPDPNLKEAMQTDDYTHLLRCCQKRRDLQAGLRGLRAGSRNPGAHRRGLRPACKLSGQRSSKGGGRGGWLT